MVRWVGVFARLVVGGVWLYAGAVKLPHPDASVSAVRSYQLVPTDLAETVGHVLPMLEVVVGGCLVLGLLVRFTGLMSALMQLAFVIGIISVWSRGIAIDCGCFGNGGPDPDAVGKYPWEIARDSGLLALSLLLVWRPRTPFAADNLLFPSQPRPSTPKPSTPKPSTGNPSTANPRLTEEWTMSKQGREQNRTQRAAAIRAEQDRKERNRRMALVAGIVVLLGAVLAGGVWYSSGGGGAKAGDATGPKVAATELGLTVGNSDAPVKVVVYEDFQCPYCRELEISTRTFLRENAAKGKVYVEYQPINLVRDRPYSAQALNAWVAVLHNASPDAALKLHDLLYDNQPYEQDSGSITNAQIAAWVKQAGGDNAAVREAMKTRDDTYFNVVDQLIVSQGIQGTPTVYLDGKELPTTTVTEMVSTIEKAVDQGS